VLQQTGVKLNATPQVPTETKRMESRDMHSTRHAGVQSSQGRLNFSTRVLSRWR
jgi:hypothetical protein